MASSARNCRRATSRNAAAAVAAEVAARQPADCPADSGGTATCSGISGSNAPSPITYHPCARGTARRTDVHVYDRRIYESNLPFASRMRPRVSSLYQIFFFHSTEMWIARVNKLHRGIFVPLRHDFANEMISGERDGNDSVSWLTFSRRDLAHPLTSPSMTLMTTTRTRTMSMTTNGHNRDEEGGHTLDFGFPRHEKYSSIH